MFLNPPYRISIAICCLLTVAGMLSGCGTFEQSVASVNPAGWFRNGTEESSDSNEEMSMEDQNPFEVTGEEQQKIQTVSATKPVSSKLSADNPDATPEFDAATMMLIETEFKDASPEERRRWYEELRQVPPDMVPRIIRMRRLAQQHSEEKRHSSALASAENGRNAEHESPIVNPSGNDLQGANPWEAESQRELRPGDVIALGGEEESEKVQAVSRSKPAIQANSLAGKEVSDEIGNQPDPPPKTDVEEYQEALESLISILEKRVQMPTSSSVSQGALRQAQDHVFLRMLYLMNNQQERTLEAIPGLADSEQEFWQKTFWSLSNYFDTEGIPQKSDRATHTISQLSEAVNQLRKQANLEIRNVTFSRGIQGFGMYERFEKDEFRPGQPVLIYAEMRNFASDMTNEGQYKTVLKSSIEIHRAGSNPGLIVEQEYPPTEDYCRTRRHDYFHSYKVNIPKELTVGPYVLKLIVEDQLGEKVASYTINFTVK